jgi:hypothetical protein
VTGSLFFFFTNQIVDSSSSLRYYCTSFSENFVAASTPSFVKFRGLSEKLSAKPYSTKRPGEPVFDILLGFKEKFRSSSLVSELDGYNTIYLYRWHLFVKPGFNVLLSLSSLIVPINILHRHVSGKVSLIYV